MADIIRDAPLGQIIRWVTSNKFLKYPEEEDGFQCPNCYRDSESPDSLSTIDEKPTDPATSDNVGREEVKDSASEEHDLSEDVSTQHDLVNLQPHKTNVTVKSSIDHRPDLEKLHTHKTNVTIRSSMGSRPTLTRTKTREMTRAFTRERFDIEREEQSLKELNMPIVAQKTEEGDVLVDWYTTDDPANPQNWSSKKKAFAGLIILCVSREVGHFFES